MKKILLLIAIALPLVLVSCGDDEPKTPEDHEYVDLGLPSGTLWATCNVGADSPEEYGYYFAWGETAPKDLYSWATYKWCNGTNTTIKKYCTDGNFGTVDGKTELEPEDDAAYVNWGSKWRMPTLEQLQELLNNCTWQWIQRNGVNGQLVTGPNGNTMFLPAAGGRTSHLYNDGEHAYYWTRTLCTCDKLQIEAANLEDAYILSFRSFESHVWYDVRHDGNSVRAVRVSKK